MAQPSRQLVGGVLHAGWQVIAGGAQLAVGEVAVTFSVGRIEITYNPESGQCAVICPPDVPVMFGPCRDDGDDEEDASAQVTTREGDTSGRTPADHGEP